MPFDRSDRMLLRPRAGPAGAGSGGSSTGSGRHRWSMRWSAGHPSDPWGTMIASCGAVGKELSQSVVVEAAESVAGTAGGFDQGGDCLGWGGGGGAGGGEGGGQL